MFTIFIWHDMFNSLNPIIFFEIGYMILHTSWLYMCVCVWTDPQIILPWHLTVFNNSFLYGWHF